MYPVAVLAFCWTLGRSSDHVDAPNPGWAGRGALLVHMTEPRGPLVWPVRYKEFRLDRRVVGRQDERAASPKRADSGKRAYTSRRR